jgi:hypothetical protein
MAGQMDRRDFLRSLGVSTGALSGSIPLIGMAQRRIGEGKHPSALQDRALIFTGPPRCLVSDVQGPAAGGGRDQRHRRLLGAVRSRCSRRTGCVGADGNVKELRRLKLRKIDSSAASPRAATRRRRPAQEQGPDDIRRWLHGFPVRQGRAEPGTTLPHHQHPVG